MSLPRLTVTTLRFGDGALDPVAASTLRAVTLYLPGRSFVRVAVRFSVFLKRLGPFTLTFAVTPAGNPVMRTRKAPLRALAANVAPC
ncbi:MAG: hypothetical protein V9G09_15515 [Candidatus Nanopelagicales bacterium]